MKHGLIQNFCVLTLIYLLAGCSMAIDSFSNNLNEAVMSNNDSQTVMQGLPAYLILLDGFIESDPDDEDLLFASAKLLNAYAGLIGTQIVLMGDEDDLQKQILILQQRKLTNKAFERSVKAICLYDDDYCGLNTIKYSEFKNRLKDFDEDDIGMLYNLGTAWASWLQMNTDDWNATAQLPQIKLIMETVIQLDEKWQNAGAHMYMGVLNSILPATLGGKPETGKMHFESAIKLTNGNNLMAKVLYAEYYARLTFDKKLHEELINDILTAENKQTNLTLLNTLAKQKAKALQARAEDYF